MGVKQADMPCPFRQEADPDARCNKKGGVCTLRPYTRVIDNKVTAEPPFVTMCPNRFWQNNEIFRWVGQEVIGTSKPTLIREVDFLERLTPSTAGDEPSAGSEDPATAASEGKEGKPVGRIDLVLMHPDNVAEWCALELQGVYFSGEGMPSHLAQYGANADGGLVWPDKIRRPDWRSSGPKRLMPQLQTKIPTLRRWGKKMAAVIDKPFYEQLGKFTPIPHLSNADIAWFVVEYDHETGEMKLADRVFTTLESSVEGLTAGLPKSRQDFEDKLKQILDSNKKSVQKKVIRLQDR